ncbi:hypothetical protein B0E47_02840 [Rhodanobacter sp. B05]|nr:hypothetical protein B0E47_02840 [Rhodanobacter sp. B05]
MSKRVQLIVLGIVLALSMASFAIARLYSPSLAFKIGVAPVVFAGLALFGHLITLDDDARGGFSNPQSSSGIWRSSLLALTLKAGLFGLVCFLVFSGL